MTASQRLGLAASPVFLLMALLNLPWLSSGGSSMICGKDSAPLSGMVAMYLLMSVAHARPWFSLGDSPRRAGYPSK